MRTSLPADPLDRVLRLADADLAGDQLGEESVAERGEGLGLVLGGLSALVEWRRQRLDLLDELGGRDAESRPLERVTREHVDGRAVRVAGHLGAESGEPGLGRKR